MSTWRFSSFAYVVLLGSLGTHVPLQAQDQVSALFEALQTNDFLSQGHARFLFEGPRTNLAWPHPNESPQSVGLLDWNASLDLFTGDTRLDRYHSEKLSLLPSRKWNENLITYAGVGIHRLNLQKVTTHLVTHEVGAEWVPSLGEWLGLSTRRDYLLSQFTQPGAVRERTQAQWTRFQWQRKWLSRIRSQILLTHTAFSNANSRREGDMSVLYGILPGDPWLWLGWGAYLFRTDRVSAEYWSPTRFWATGPRLEASTTLPNDWILAGGLNLNRLREEEFRIGWGYYGVASLRTAPRDRRRLELTYIRNISSQLGNTWVFDQYQISAVLPL